MVKDDDYISSDITQKLIELGYDGRVDTVYNKNRIHFYEATKWLRNKHQLHVCVDCCNMEFLSIKKVWYYTVSEDGVFFPMSDDRSFNTYEEALTRGIEEALKLIDK